ncbi:MAG: anti-sigma factor antagonist [Lawsonibacter sp.]
MAVTCTEENRRLTASVSGELDHHGAKVVMEELDRRIDAALPKELTVDLSNLTFTDSSGIAVLLRARKRMGQVRGSMRVVNTPDQAGKVFRAAGLQRLIRFE